MGIGPRVSTSVDSAISEAQKESSSLDDSKVSVIPGADDSLLMDGGGGQSTHMDRFHTIFTKSSAFFENVFERPCDF